MRCGQACCFLLSDTTLAHENRKEKFTLFSDHHGSLLRQQPGALPIRHDAVGCHLLLLSGLGFRARCSTALLYVHRQLMTAADAGTKVPAIAHAIS